MSSMRRYLAALLALVMLLSLFTGALGEEGIAAIEAGAEAEVLAAEDVAEEIADDAGEDEEIVTDEAEEVAAVEAEEIVAEVEAAELPEAEPSDEEAPVNYDGEEAVDEAEDEPEEELPLFQSSNDVGEEFYTGDETLYPNDIDIFVEVNGRNQEEHSAAVASDTIQFFADVKPRDAVNPGITWEARVDEIFYDGQPYEVQDEDDEDSEDGEGGDDYNPDDYNYDDDYEDYDDWYYMDNGWPEAHINSNGVLTLKNIYHPVDVVVEASTIGFPDGSQKKLWDPVYVTPIVEEVYNEEYDEYDEVIVGWRDNSGKEYPIAGKFDDIDIIYNGRASRVEIDWQKTDAAKGKTIYYYVDEYYSVPSEITKTFHLHVYPTTESVDVYVQNGEDIEYLYDVVLEADETATYSVGTYPEYTLPGMTVTDNSREYLNDSAIGKNTVSINGDATITLAPAYDEDGALVSGESVYVIRSGDGCVDTLLWVYRKPGNVEAFDYSESFKANPTVEIGLKQVIDLQNYSFEVWFNDEDRIEGSVELFSFVPAEVKPRLVFSTDSKGAKIVDVSEDGYLYGKKKGTATVTASIKGQEDKSLSFKVTVKEKAATKVTLSGPRYLDGTGDMTDDGIVKAPVQFKATVTPAKASQKVYWASSDETVVTVDQSGKVTPVDYGEAEIIAFTMDGSDHMATYPVLVVDPIAHIDFHLDGAYQYFTADGQRISVLGLKAEDDAYGSRTFKSELLGGDDDEGDEDGESIDENDENNDENIDEDYEEDLLEEFRFYGWTLKTDKAGAKIITIKKNKYGETTVTGKKTGTAKVWFVSEDGLYDGNALKEYCYVNVVKPVKVTLGLADASGAAIKDRAFGIADIGGLSGKYTFTISAPGNKVNDDCFMESDDEGIVDAKYNEEEDNYSLVFGGEAGTATITCTLGDLRSVGTMKITVERPIENLFFEDWDKAQTYEVAKGKKPQMPMPHFEPSTSQTDLIWETSNKAVATVSSTGVVTGKKAGKVIITARSKANKEICDSIPIEVKAKPVSKITLAVDGGEQFKGVANTWFFPVYGDEKTIKLTPTVAPANASQLVEWDVIDDDSYTYDGSFGFSYEDGSITVYDGFNGSVVVTAKAKDGSGKKASTTLVFDDYVKDINITGNSPDGTEVWLKAKDYFWIGNDDAEERLSLVRAGEEEDMLDGRGWEIVHDDLTWSVTTAAGKKVVSVDAWGGIYAKKAGTAVVRATSKQTGVTRDIRVRVYDAPASVVINEAVNGVVSLYGEGDTLQLTATVTAQKKKTAPNGVYWLTGWDSKGVSVDMYTGVVTAESDTGHARVYAIPRYYDVGSYLDPEYLAYYNIVMAVADIYVEPEADEVRVYGMHSVAINNTITLVGRAYIDDALANYQGLTWSVKPGSESILSVDDKTGVVKGLKEGRGYVLATAKGVRAGNDNAPVCQFYVDVTVPINKMSIVAWTDYIDLEYNDSIQLSVVCDPANANPKVTWSSSNTKVLVVDANGLVSASPKLKLKDGQYKSAVITATAVDKSGKKLSAKITIEVGLAGE